MFQESFKEPGGLSGKHRGKKHKPTDAGRRVAGHLRKPGHWPAVPSKGRGRLTTTPGFYKVTGQRWGWRGRLGVRQRGDLTEGVLGQGAEMQPQQEPRSGDSDTKQGKACSLCAGSSGKASEDSWDAASPAVTAPLLSGCLAFTFRDKMRSKN